MKFAHLADCHLGGWRQEELRQLNLDSFKKALDICIKEKVGFVLIAGDLFDSAYPPIEILESAFEQLKRLKDNNIPCYIIAGSHDYSASGKTFLSVLEKAGFCINIFQPEEIKDRQEIYLNPIIHGSVALYGYPGKKSGLEVNELKKVKLHESPGFFKILALHTCITDAVGNLPIDSINQGELPKADYYALGHLHISYNKNRLIYAGPTFPNNFQELEELKAGSFYIIDTSDFNVRKIELKLKETEVFDLKISNTLTATEKIIAEFDKKNLENKIILLKLSGKIEQGKTSSINFKEIEEFARNKKAYSMLKSTSKLVTEEPEINIEIEDMDKIEKEIITKYIEENKSEFNNSIFPLISALSLEKQEDETSPTFQSRLISELNKVLNLEA